MATENEIPNGTYTVEHLSRMRGRRAWNVFITFEEGNARDAARADLISDAIGQIQDAELATGIAAAAVIYNGQVLEIEIDS